jgi:hypothetical protein
MADDLVHPPRPARPGRAVPRRLGQLRYRPTRSRAARTSPSRLTRAGGTGGCRRPLTRTAARRPQPATAGASAVSGVSVSRPSARRLKTFTLVFKDKDVQTGYMAHLCGAPNRTRPGTCRRRVKYGHCWQHRYGLGAFPRPTVSAPARAPRPTRHAARTSVQGSAVGHSQAAATLVADALTDGLIPSLADRVADRVADYLGWAGRWRLRRRRWRAVDCRLLAQTARAVLDLKHKLHEVTGEAVSRLLPPNTPRFHRMLVKKIAEKLPLPPDVKLEAIARGLQVIGIFMCVVQNLPLEHCACLQMLGAQLVKEQAKRYVEGLLEETWRDLRGITSPPGSTTAP